MKSTSPLFSFAESPPGSEHDWLLKSKRWWRCGAKSWNALVLSFLGFGGSVIGADTDNDRMDDAYETTYGLSVGIDDRYRDLDNDGCPNLAEYLKSTAANDAGSVPTADRVVGSGQTYTTISAAITSLSTDDQIILVKAGVYSEAFSNTSRRVFIIAESVDPYLTTIKNPSSGTLIDSTKDLYLRGFALAVNGGTGIQFASGTANHAVVQCIIQGYGTGIYIQPNSYTRITADITDCIIQDGTSCGIYAASYAATLRLTHCTITGHATSGSGKAIYSTGDSSSISASNCIFWNGGSSEIYSSGSGSTVSVTYSCVSGTPVFTGTGNINTDPELAQGYLSSTSPCIDAAQTLTPAQVEDVRGETRPAGSGPDMGAHEYQTTGVWAADTDGDTLSDADEIYSHGTSLFSTDTDSDRMTDDYEVDNGLNALADDRYEDLDGDGFANLLESLKSSAADNASSKPTADRTVGPGETYTTIASAVSSLSADDQLILVKPGVYTESISSSSRKSFIVAEDADPYATIIRPSGSTVFDLSKDTYLRGFAVLGSGNGTGIYLSTSGNYGVVQCILRSFSYGIYCEPSYSQRVTLDVGNTLIHEGSSSSVGIYGSNYPVTLRLTHCTITNLGSTDNGKSITTQGYSSVITARNCIFWNGTSGSEIAANGGSSTISVTYSCVKGGSVYTGTGNINTDPLLLQGYIANTSPCIDAAQTLTPAQVEDVRGETRPAGSGPDMGAHEYQTTGVWAADTDGDTLSDADEIYSHGTSLFSTDTDSDRMTDDYEVAHGLSSLVDDRYYDLDGDGFPNLAEFLKSTSASSDSSVPTPDRTVGAGETYATISAAITSLSADDQIILVKPGDYEEALTSDTRRTFIISQSSDPYATRVKAGSNVVTSSKDIYLRGLHIVSSGGASIYLHGSTANGLLQCVLTGGAYGVYAEPSSSSRITLDVVNSIIQNATSCGIYASANPVTLRLMHTSIVGNASNEVSGNGRAIQTYGYSSVLSVENSILWNGGASEVSSSGGTVAVSYSCVRGASVYTGVGNINTDPLLVQGYLSSASPCVDAAVGLTPSLIYDVRGQARPNGSANDMGAHEYRTDGIWAADFDGDTLVDSSELYTHGSYFYLADSDADRIDDAYEATNGLSILVDDRWADPDGDRYPNLAEYLKSTAANSAGSSPTPDKTVGIGESYTTISAALTSLSGDDGIILVKAGLYTEQVNNANATDSLNKRVMIIAEASEPGATVVRSPTTSDATFRSTKDMYLRGLSIVSEGAEGVRFSGLSGSYAVYQCFLTGHSKGIVSYPTNNSQRNTLDVVNCLISGGRSNAIYCEHPVNCTITHSTIVDHTGGAYSGSGWGLLSLNASSTVTITNSIFSNPGATTEIYANSAPTLISYSCVRGSSAPSGPGNISSLPQLTLGYPRPSSPCIDTGTAVAAISKDFRGGARDLGAAPDMGCYETLTGGRPHSADHLFELLLGSSMGGVSADRDGDGLDDTVEWRWGTDPYFADTDGDGVNDALDRFPLDPNASGVSGGSDSTPPAISITSPSGALKL